MQGKEGGLEQGTVGSDAAGSRVVRAMLYRISKLASTVATATVIPLSDKWVLTFVWCFGFN